MAENSTYWRNTNNRPFIPTAIAPTTAPPAIAPALKVNTVTFNVPVPAPNVPAPAFRVGGFKINLVVSTLCAPVSTLNMVTGTFAVFAPTLSVLLF